MSKRRFARSGQTDRHAASLIDTHETRVSNHSRGENRCLPARGLGLCVHVPTLAGIVLAGSRDVRRSTITPRGRRDAYIQASHQQTAAMDTSKGTAPEDSREGSRQRSSGVAAKRRMKRHADLFLLICFLTSRPNAFAHDSKPAAAR